MDTFRDLVEANIGTLAAAAGGAVTDKVVHGVKQAGNSMLARVSARATGRLDLGNVYQDTLQKWKYFVTTQRVKPTVATFVDFIQTVYGMNIPQDAIYSAIYGFDPTKSPKPPQVTSPNQSMLKSYFKIIFSNTATQPKLLSASQHIVQYAEADEADENYVVLMLKWLGSKNPQMLKRAGMEPLQAYSHGGNLSKDDLSKLIKSFASLIIKQTMKMRRDDAEDKGENNDTGDKQEIATEQSDKVSSTETKISLDPPSTQQIGNWGGLARPKQHNNRLTRTDVIRNVAMIGFKNMNFESYANAAEADAFWDQFQDLIEKKPYKMVNAMSAQLMMVIGRLTSPPSEFLTVVEEFQKSNGGIIFWPKPNFTAALNYARVGGNFDEITAELNHFLNTGFKASLIYICLQRFIAKQDKRGNSGEAAPDENTQ